MEDVALEGRLFDHSSALHMCGDLGGDGDRVVPASFSSNA